jgi:hypothetical protein
MSYQINSNKFFPIAAMLLLIASLSACKKSVTVPPPVNQVVSSVVFEDDATALSALTGIYAEMMNGSNQFSTGNTTFYAGMSADELKYYATTNRNEFVSNEITTASHGTLSSFFWDRYYRYIYVANLCIEGSLRSKSLTTDVRKYLEGEAKFIRAFCYFYLVNLFGDVPLIIQTDYATNAQLPRTAATAVYTQIIQDLEEAQVLLPTTYAIQERVRPNKWTVTALLARVYLYQKNWDSAEKQATALIESGIYALSNNLNTVFLKNSPETIWQLYPVNPIWNTWEGRDILPSSSSAIPQYLVTSHLLTAFEPTDQRRSSWIASRIYSGQLYHYPFKYKVYGNGAPQTEYYVVLRLAEQYLIRAEARAHQNKLAAGAGDINIIRQRANLPALSFSNHQSLLAAVDQERRIELFAEWGHRWLDLKRTQQADAVLGVVKESTWQPTDVLWPIPQNQLNANPALKQNPGY